MNLIEIRSQEGATHECNFFIVLSHPALPHPAFRVLVFAEVSCRIPVPLRHRNAFLEYPRLGDEGKEEDDLGKWNWAAQFSQADRSVCWEDTATSSIYTSAGVPSSDGVREANRLPCVADMWCGKPVSSGLTSDVVSKVGEHLVSVAKRVVGKDDDTHRYIWPRMAELRRVVYFSWNVEDQAEPQEIWRKKLENAVPYSMAAPLFVADCLSHKEEFRNPRLGLNMWAVPLMTEGTQLHTIGSGPTVVKVLGNKSPSNFAKAGILATHSKYGEDAHQTHRIPAGTVLVIRNIQEVYTCQPENQKQEEEGDGKRSTCKNISEFCKQPGITIDSDCKSGKCLGKCDERVESLETGEKITQAVGSVVAHKFGRHVLPDGRCVEKRLRAMIVEVPPKGRPVGPVQQNDGDEAAVLSSIVGMWVTVADFTRDANNLGDDSPIVRRTHETSRFIMAGATHQTSRFIEVLNDATVQEYFQQKLPAYGRRGRRVVKLAKTAVGLPIQAGTGGAELSRCLPAFCPPEGNNQDCTPQVLPAGDHFEISDIVAVYHEEIFDVTEGDDTGGDHAPFLICIVATARAVQPTEYDMRPVRDPEAAMWRVQLHVSQQGRKSLETDFKCRHEDRDFEADERDLCESMAFEDIAHGGGSAQPGDAGGEDGGSGREYQTVAAVGKEYQTFASIACDSRRPETSGKVKVISTVLNVIGYAAWIITMSWNPIGLFIPALVTKGATAHTIALSISWAGFMGAATVLNQFHTKRDRFSTDMDQKFATGGQFLMTFGAIMYVGGHTLFKLLPGHHHLGLAAKKAGLYSRLIAFLAKV